MSAKVNYEQIKSRLTERRAFEGNTMRAIEGATWGTGQLPAEHRQAYEEARFNNDIGYTVISYRTPIAWTLRDGSVVIPDVRYSVTTSRQQGLCRAYLDR